MATANPTTAIQKKVEVSISDGKTFSEEVFFLHLESVGNVTSEKEIKVTDGESFSGAFKQIQFRFDKDRNYIYTKNDNNQKEFDEKYKGTALEFSISGLSAGNANTVIRTGRSNSANDVVEKHNGPADRVKVIVETVASLKSDEVIKDDEFWPKGAPIASYGNQFIRSGEAGTIEFNTPKNSFPANAQLYFEGGIQKNMVGMKDGDDEVTFIFKENHGAPGNKDGKHNVKVTLKYQGAKDGKPAKYKGEVELGVEDDHDANSSPKALKDVKYQNEDVLTKYTPGDKPIRAKGSYRDTKDGGVRYTLEVQDPETKEWKKIFDHVDHGDDNHKIENYRGKSAFRSSIRIDGCTTTKKSELKKIEEILEDIEEEQIDVKKSEEQQEALKKFGYGNIKFEEIQPDND
jgi:hypothetical protein